MKYEIDRLVCNEEERQKVLPTGQFEVIKNTYMFFKIPVMNKVAPGKLVITYAAGSKLHNRQNRKPVDLRLFYSWSNREKEPTEASFEKVYNNPKVVTLNTLPGSEQYLTDYVYFSLLSHSGCLITITTHFKDDPQQHQQTTV